MNEFDPTSPDYNVTSLEKLLQGACERAIAAGYSIVPDDMKAKVQGPKCCPFGALYNELDCFPYPDGFQIRAKLGIAWPVLEAFINGFGGDRSDLGVMCPNAYQLGVQFRKRYTP